MIEPSDRELWHLAKRGDPESFGLLFDRHARTVYNFCFRRTADWSMAEDLTSLVFLEAWRRRAEVHPQHETLRPWLLGVATNVIRNSNRSQRRRDAAEPRSAVSAELADFADEVARRLDDEARMRRVVSALEELPTTDRDVVSLWAWGNLSYAQIAEVLDIPVGTVRSRLSRARARLRELTGGIGHEQDDLEPHPVGSLPRRNPR